MIEHSRVHQNGPDGSLNHILLRDGKGEVENLLWGGMGFQLSLKQRVRSKVRLEENERRRAYHIASDDPKVAPRSTSSSQRPEEIRHVILGHVPIQEMSGVLNFFFVLVFFSFCETIVEKSRPNLTEPSARTTSTATTLSKPILI